MNGGEKKHDREVQENYRGILKAGYERMGIRKSPDAIEKEAQTARRSVDQRRDEQKKGSR